jgi:predicted nucleic acid-binding protein
MVKKLRIYLDLCALQRPYDDQAYPRIQAETAAVMLITAQVKRKKYVLMFSPVHVVELSADRDETKRLELQKLLLSYGEDAASLVEYKAVALRGLDLESRGLGIADAMHAAYAEACAADFITCDDDLLRKCLRHRVETWCGTPLDFGKKEGLL